MVCFFLFATLCETTVFFIFELLAFFVESVGSFFLRRFAFETLGFFIFGTLGFGIRGLLTLDMSSLNKLFIDIKSTCCEEKMVSSSSPASLSFEHILVPYDGTKTGEKAFSGALKLAKKFSSKITVLSCIEKESTFVFFETKSDKKTAKKRNKTMQEKIAKMEQQAAKLEIKFASKITNCSLASKCIVSYVKSHKIDLIVMSKSSKVSPEKIYHDSTVNYVYGHVDCPMFNI